MYMLGLYIADSANTRPTVLTQLNYKIDSSSNPASTLYIAHHSPPSLYMCM
jgi:hypothetical protein